MIFLHLTIATKMDRNQALSKTREAISTAGGWIVDHSLFSNKSATLNFELPLKSVQKLMADLKAAGFHPTLQGDLPAGNTGELRGTVALTFIHQDPDLKRDIPAFG